MLIHYFICILDKGSGDFPTPRQPSIHMGTNQLYTYERATENKKFGGEGHTRPLSSQRSSISSAIGSQFINPMYDDFEDENTDEYTRDCKHHIYIRTL